MAIDPLPVLKLITALYYVISLTELTDMITGFLLIKITEL